MSTDNSSVIITPATSLCFDKEEFLKGTFCVDKFVSEHRKQASLETIRDDLGNYLRVLRSAMIELINKDYADFVHLSTNLVGLDKAISNLSIPLGQLREEVLSVKAAVGEVLENGNSKLEQKRKIQHKKIVLQRLAFVIEEIERTEHLLGYKTSEEFLDTNCMENGKKWSDDVMERASVQISQLKFHLNKLPALPIVQKIKPRVENLKRILQSYLEESFINAIEESNKEALSRILFINSNINQVLQLEKFYQDKVVRPFMREVITEKALELQGVGPVFTRVLHFIPSKCEGLLEVTRGRYRNPGVTNYNFLTNSVWPEIVECLESCTPYIFSPGNPDVFQQRYSESMSFLEHFESFYSTIEDIQNFRQTNKYQIFLGKWNLEIYFRIRYQQIAGHLENAFSTPFQHSPGDQLFLLHVTKALWECLHQCWSDVIYLAPLTDKFWKLTLQLVSRFCKWVTSQLPEKESPSRSREDSPNPDGSLSLSIPPSSTDSAETKAQAENSVLNVVKLVADIHTLENVLPILLKDIIEPKMCLTGVHDADILQGGFEDSLDSLRELIPLAGRTIIGDVVSYASQTLKLVSDIPRLYRKTNREVPSKPSAYVITLGETLEKFIKSDEAISFVWKEEWTTNILEKISEQYLSITAEVLTSVKKMEDSLKRLKRARDKGSAGTMITPGLGMSDDDKIRLQLWLDVEQFGKMIESLGASKDDVKGFENLVELVSSARNSPSSGPS